MKHLIGRAYMSSLYTMRSSLHRIVVGHIVDETFLDAKDQALAGLLEDDDVPRTIHYTNQPKEFVDNDFPTYFAMASEKAYPIRFNVDDDAYLRIFVKMLKHIFPDITVDQFKQLIRADIADRICTDLSFRLQYKEYQETFIDKAFADVVYAEQLKDTITDNWDNMSIEYRLILAMRGVGKKETANTLRKFIAEAFEHIIRDAQKTILRLFYTPGMLNVTGVNVDELGLNDFPTTGIENLKVIHNIGRTHDELKNAKDLTTFISDISQDLELIFKHPVAYDMEFFTLAIDPSDDRVINAYVDKVLNNASFHQIMPESMTSRVSLNLFSMLYKMEQLGELPKSIMDE